MNAKDIIRLGVTIQEIIDLFTPQEEEKKKAEGPPVHAGWQRMTSPPDGACIGHYVLAVRKDEPRCCISGVMSLDYNSHDCVWVSTTRVRIDDDKWTWYIDTTGKATKL